MTTAPDATMTLRDVATTVESLDRAKTIYAQPPWTPDAIAVVELEPENGGVPERARSLNMTYFLEVSIARDVLEAPAVRCKDVDERARRLIEYATRDA